MEKVKSKYNSLAEWSKYDWKGYLKARNGELIPKICETFGWELPKENKPNGYWTLELCKEEALNYPSRTEWQKNSKASYQAARKKNWLNEASPHMKPMNPKGYWTKERCQEEGLKYNRKSDWQKSHPSSYQYSRKNDWMDEHSVHMLKISENNKPSGYWTLERCQEESLKYITRGEWHKNSSGSYSSSWKKGWLEECTKHMEK